MKKRRGHIFTGKLLAVALAALPAAKVMAIVTNSATLQTHLGFGGTPGVDFAFEATVEWGSSEHCQNFYAKTPDGYIRLVDQKSRTRPFLRRGDVVSITGTTVILSNGFVNADCKSTKVIRHEKLEPPRDSSIEEVLAGRHLYRPVRVQGTVRDTFADEIDHLYRHIIISSGSKSLGLSIPSAECDAAHLANLVGAEIRATGCHSPMFGGFRRLSRCEINLRSTNDLEIVSPPSDPFSAPSVASIDPETTDSILNLGRHTASGIVTAVWHGDEFAVRTGNGTTVNVRLADSPPPAVGDCVEVAGFPDTDLYRINLRRAVWRITPGTARRKPEKAQPVAAEMLFTDGQGHKQIRPDYHGKAISMEGTVTGVPSAGTNGGIVHLQCGEFAIEADASAIPSAISQLQPGCKVRVSGTCIVKTDSWHPNEPLPRIHDVVIAVRDASDVTILAPPPWWTPKRFAVLVAALLAALAGFILWNVLLRRLAERRGRELLEANISQVETKLKVQERTRIAVELHDTIAQNLTGVSLEIDSAAQLAAKDPSGMMKHLSMAGCTLQTCRNELRNCLWDLRSRALEEDDLNEAVRRTVAPQISGAKLSIRFNVPRKSLTDDTVYVLMRIVRELVMNAVRHGKASSVKIAGSLEGGFLLFSVCDNGCGFDPSMCPGVMQGHFGLQGIRERLNLFDGGMDIRPSSDGGTKVSVRMKLPGNPANRSMT